MKRQKSKAREIHSIERKRLKASLQRMEQTLTTERAQLQRVTAKRDAHEAALESLKQRVQRMQRKTVQVQEDAERQAKAAAEASFQEQLLAHEEHCEEVTRDLEEMEQIASLDGPTVRWDRPEAFLKGLMAIPRVRVRLRPRCRPAPCPAGNHRHPATRVGALALAIVD